MSARCWAVVMLMGVAAAALGAATAPASSATLLGGRIAFVPPPDDVWQRAENVVSDDAAAFAGRKHEGAIAIQVLPADAEITPQMGGAVVRALRDAHKKAGEKIVMDPKVEPDKRFALRVHEKYQHGDKTADELHLYKNLGPRVVMVTVNTWVADDAAARALQAAGEDVGVSARWVKPPK